MRLLCLLAKFCGGRQINSKEQEQDDAIVNKNKEGMGTDIHGKLIIRGSVPKPQWLMVCLFLVLGLSEQDLTFRCMCMCVLVV